MKPYRKIAKIFGYELIKRSKHPTLSPHIINLINHYKIDLVLDVGANYGQFGKMLRDEGYKGEIHSFEPVSHSFDNLQKTCINDEKWFVHKLAMGAADGKGTINVTDASDMSSFLNPNAFGEGKFEKINVVHREMVEIETIDGFLLKEITDFNKRRIFLKIDTQGYDLKVLEGSLNAIDYIVCILTEISLIPIYSGMPHYLDALRKYEEYGFVVTGLYPVSRDKKNLSVIEMDCALINSKKT
jgi:FkbM family methyltransferase